MDPSLKWSLQHIPQQLLHVSIKSTPFCIFSHALSQETADVHFTLLKKFLQDKGNNDNNKGNPQARKK